MKSRIRQMTCPEELGEIFMKEDVLQKEHDLVTMLIDEIKKKKGNSPKNSEDDVFSIALGYLNEHNMLLRDSVYPHLCTEQFK